LADSRNVSIDDIKRQIERIVQSRELESSPRLQEFLKFIVDEYLAGRAGRIKGVTIAQAVFGANDSFDPESNSIVRVEAGRLRRRLKEYYLASGALDPVIIEVPKGGYVPAFRRREPDLKSADEAASGGTPPRRYPGKRSMLGAAAVLTVALLASWAWFLFRSATPPEPSDDAGSQNVVHYADEADVLARQAWELLMPPEDSTRLETAIELFDHVIERAPNRPQGYASKSLAYSIGVLFIKSQNPPSDLATAIDLARQAVSMDDGYALGWAAMALSHSLDGDREAALEYARKAVADRPTDVIIPSVVGLVLLNSERSDDARTLMIDVLSKQPPQARTPFLNVLGIAQYVSGDYRAAAESFEKNLSIGGPSGPQVDLFLAATYGQLDQEFRARAILERMQQVAPGFPAREWLAWFVKPATQLEALMNSLHALGLEEEPS